MPTSFGFSAQRMVVDLVRAGNRQLLIFHTQKSCGRLDEPSEDKLVAALTLQLGLARTSFTPKQCESRSFRIHLVADLGKTNDHEALRHKATAQDVVRQQVTFSTIPEGVSDAAEAA